MNAMLSSFVPALGWALIDFLWQGLLVGMAAASALMLLRNARPQARYMAAGLALALCIALPVAGVWRGLHAAPVQAGAAVVEPASAGMASASARAGDGPPTFAGIASLAPVTAAAWQSTLQGQLPWIVALWSVGAGLLALRMSIGMAWVGRIGRLQAGVMDRAWQERLDRLAMAIGLQRDVRLRIVQSELDSPVAAGVWRPLVLVPAALIACMPSDLLEALFAHELAHIRRHDYLVNLVQSAVEALLFYHPVVWWLSRQIRIEREQIADDLAARALGEPRRLALALHELDRLQLDGFTTHHACNPRLVPAANGGNLMSRIQRLIQSGSIRPSQHALSLKMALPIIGLAAACLTVYAHNSAAVVVATTPASPAIATVPVIVSVAGGTAAAAPVVQAAGNTRVIHGPGAHEDAYALVRANKTGMTMSGDTRDIADVEKIKQRVHGDFLWARRGGKAYLVQDPAVIARVEEAWKPAEAVDAQMDALNAKMAIPEHQMDALSKQMEAISGANSPADAAMEKSSAQMEALSRQQEALGAQMETLGRRMEQAKLSEQEALARQMETLQAQMEPLSAQMEQLGKVMEQHGREMEAAQKPLEDLGKRMEAASKPMEELGKQMEVLGSQMEQISHAADREVNAQIDQAIRSGKAVPADGAAPR